MVEVVVIHDLFEVEKDGSKQLVSVQTQTFTITYLEDDGKTIAADVPTDNRIKKLSNQDISPNDIDDEQQQIQEYIMLNNRNGVKILNRRYNQKTDEVSRLNNVRTRYNIDKSSSTSSDDSMAQDESNSSNDTSNLITELPHTTCEFCLKDFPTLVHKRRHKRKRHFYCVHCNTQYHDAISVQQHPCAVVDKSNTSNLIHKNNTSNTSIAEGIKNAKEGEGERAGVEKAETSGKFYASTSDSETRPPSVKIVPQCKVCGKEFRNNYMLKRHEVIHTGEKPYKCDECTKAFTQVAGLNRHKKIHLKKRMPDGSIFKYPNYECEICNKLFRNQKYLELHKASYHDNEYFDNGGGVGGNGSDSLSSLSLINQEISHDDRSLRNDDSISVENFTIDDNYLDKTDIL